MAYRWKGNVRELHHVLESLVLLSDGPEIDVKDLPPQILGAATAAPSALPSLPEEDSRLEEYLASQERGIPQAALDQEAASRRALRGGAASPRTG